MPITLGKNIASSGMQRRISTNADALTRVYERLASGQRINRASDDAAGLAISESLRADTRVYAQALRNVNDGISLLSIVDSALGELQTITERQYELAMQAANGVYSNAQRRALSSELQALTKEYNRIIEGTSFNGMSILQDPTQNVTLQVGNSGSDTLSLALGRQLARTVGTGTFTSSTSFSVGGFPQGTAIADFDRNGALDFVVTTSISNRVSVRLGNGDGTFTSNMSYNTGVIGPIDVKALDVNSDRVADLVISGTGGFSVLIANGNGTFNAAISYSTGADVKNVEVADINGDGKIDVIASNDTASSVTLFLGFGNGEFGAGQTISNGSRARDSAVGDINNDGRIDLIIADYNNGLYARLGNGDGTFESGSLYDTGGFFGSSNVRLADLDADGDLDIAATQYAEDTAAILINNGDGTFKQPIIFAVLPAPVGLDLGDINGDGMDDLVIGGNAGLQVILNNGNGTFRAPITRFAIRQYDPSLGDFNGDDVLDIVSAESSSNAAQVFFADTTLSNIAQTLTLFTHADTLEAISALKQQQQRISMERAQIGVFQSRLSISANNLSSLSEVSEAAGARIRDADIAHEATELIRLQILQKITAAVLAQANQLPNKVLQLL